MPAGSETPPPSGGALPRTFRPLGVRLAVYVLGAVLVGFCALIWFAFPSEIRDQFSTFQRVTLVAIGAGFGAAGHALARSRLVARPEGLTVVNGYRTHRLEWSQVLAVRLRPGSPWATLDLSDGTTVPAMGIQGSDGARATAQARDLRRLVERLTVTERDD